MATVEVRLQESTVEMIRRYDPNAKTLDEAIEEMIIDHPPAKLLEQLRQEDKGPFVTREEAKRRRGY